MQYSEKATGKMVKSTKFAIMLGGNLGNSAEIFREAVKKLAAAGCGELKMSRIYRSAPVDCVPGTPDFSDAALTGIWPGNALELLRLCRKLEQEAGRPADHSSRESRTLDLDLILFGERILHTDSLILPHPLAHTRLFVLLPLTEIAPDALFPTLHLKASELLAALKGTTEKMPHWIKPFPL